MTTAATVIDLAALFRQAHARGLLYPRMSNTELRRALRKAHGDDEAFDDQYPESAGNFRDYHIKPLVRQLTPYGYGFSFEQKSYVFIGGLDRPAPEPMPEAQEVAQTAPEPVEWVPDTGTRIPRTTRQDERAQYADFKMPIRFVHYPNGYVHWVRSSGYDPDARSAYGRMAYRFAHNVGCDLPLHKWYGNGYVFRPEPSMSDDELYRQLVEASVVCYIDIDITAYHETEPFDAERVVLE